MYSPLAKVRGVQCLEVNYGNMMVFTCDNLGGLNVSVANTVSKDLIKNAPYSVVSNDTLIEEVKTNATEEKMIA